MGGRGGGRRRSARVLVGGGDDQGGWQGGAGEGGRTRPSTAPATRPSARVSGDSVQQPGISCTTTAPERVTRSPSLTRTIPASWSFLPASLAILEGIVLVGGLAGELSGGRGVRAAVRASTRCVLASAAWAPPEPAACLLDGRAEEGGEWTRPGRRQGDLAALQKERDRCDFCETG